MQLPILPPFLFSSGTGSSGFWIGNPARAIAKRIQFTHAQVSLHLAYQGCSPQQPHICAEAAGTRLRRVIGDAALRRAVTTARRGLPREPPEDASQVIIFKGLRKFIAQLARVARQRRFQSQYRQGLPAREHRCTEPGVCCTS